MQGHETADARSIALHRAVAAKLEGDPRVLDRARARVAAWRADGSRPERYVAAWEALLQLSVRELAARLVADDEEASALRQVSPFAGALDARERWRVIKDVR